MADRASRRHPEAAARGAGKKTPTVRRKAAEKKPMKTATGRKPAVAEGVTRSKRLGDNQTVRQGEEMGRKKAQGGAKGGEGKGGSRNQNQSRLKIGAPSTEAKVWTAEQMIADEQQEYFCLKMAEGPYSQKSAYMQAYPNSSPDSARANASRLMTKDDIRRRIGHLKKELIRDVKLTVEESIRWCLLVRDTPAGYVDDESPLAQEVTRKEMQMGGAHGQLKRGDEDGGNEIETPAAVVIETRVKMPSKMDAQKQIDKLMGFDRDKDDPLEKAVDAMADMIRMIREKRGPETA